MDTCLTSRAEHAGATTDHDPPVAGLSDMLCRLCDGSLKPKQLGVLGEQYAADWLERHGYTILGRNWHSRYGELDIVMMTPDRVIAFVEVKTRRTDHFGTPQEAVTLHKQTNLRRAGVQWLRAGPPHQAYGGAVRRAHHRRACGHGVGAPHTGGVLMAIGGSLSVGLIGLKAFIIQIQAFISPGLPYFSVIGLPDASLSESRERVKSACQASGFKWPDTRVTVNMSPASMPKRGASHDLAIAAGVLSAAGAIPHDSLEETIVLGEVNLDGTVLPIDGLLPIMLHAKERGIRRLIVPYGNEDESRLVPQMDVTCVRHVGELIELAGGRASYTLGVDRATVSCTVEDTPAFSGLGDMSEVVGQDHVKWALQVAAAGKHHLLMTGPPGSGKTMSASRMPSIMCPLTPEEQLEVASIRSLCGTLQHYGISDMPPFEAPHHTASTASLVGGGLGLAMPG